MRRANSGWCGLLAMLLIGGPVSAQDAAKAPAAALAEFSRDWREADWQPSGQGRFTVYMRPLDDQGWSVRMRAFQSLVKAGDASIEPLLKLLATGPAPERILAAQTLGFLGMKVDRQALLDAARSDPDPAVRLHAVDSLGMVGGTDLSEELATLDAAEKDRDVKRHIAYAVDRKESGLDPQTVADLRDWDARKIDTAKLGGPAPDFE